MTSPLPLPPRRRALPAWATVLIGVLIFAVLALGAFAVRQATAANPRTPAAAPSGRPAASLTPSPRSSLVGAVQDACMLNETIRDADIVAHGDAIKKIAGTLATEANMDIRFAAQMLGDRYDLAFAERGQDDAAASALDLFSASLNLATACVKAGFRP